MATSNGTMLDLAFTSKDNAAYTAAAIKAGYVLKDSKGNVQTNKDGTPKVQKPGLGEIMVRASWDGGAEQFAKVAGVAGHTAFSLSSNADPDILYAVGMKYIGDKGRYDDGDLSYAVLAAAFQYIGRTDFTEWSEARKAELGGDRKDRLAKAREKGAIVSKAKDSLLAKLAAQLGLSADQYAAMQAEAEAEAAAG